MENILAVTADNIHREHICCAISDGLVFRKLDTRAKFEKFLDEPGLKL